VSELHDALLQVDLLETAPGWRVLGQGASSVPLPAGMSVASQQPDGPAVFLMHPGTIVEDRVELNGPYPQAPRPDQLLFPGATSDGEGHTADTAVLWHALSYVHEGVQWRQRFYVLPLEDGGCMLLKTQTRARSADATFALSDLVAGGFVPPGPG